MINVNHIDIYQMVAKGMADQHTKIDKVYEKADKEMKDLDKVATRKQKEDKLNSIIKLKPQLEELQKDHGNQIGKINNQFKSQLNKLAKIIEQAEDILRRMPPDPDKTTPA